MICMRCGGLLVPEDYTDYWTMTGPMEFQGTRCVNCGSVDDAVIRANRLRFPLPVGVPPAVALAQEQPFELELESSRVA